MTETKQKTQAEIESEQERLKEFVKKILPDSWDKYDTVAKYDSTLSYAENKSAIREDLKLLIKDQLKSQVESVKAYEEKIAFEQKAKIQAEIDEYNSRVYTDIKELEVYYEPVVRAVRKMVQGHSNLAFIKGPGASGKSYWIRKSLLQNGLKQGMESESGFVEVCGKVTEAYLYRLIYENNGKVIWFKDVANLLSGFDSLNLLKSATETEDKRWLTKYNYSKEQDDLPPGFFCRCKMIFDYNALEGANLKEDFEALVTRGDYIEVSFSLEDLSNIMKFIAKEDWQKEVTDFVISNFQSNGIIRLNLRTQWKAFRTYDYAIKNNLDWKKEIKSELTNISRIRGMLYALIGNKIVSTTTLKKLLLRHELVGSIRTADRKINEWMLLEELYRIGEGEKDFHICINDLNRNSYKA